MQIVFLDAVTMGESVPETMIADMLSSLGEVKVYTQTTRENAKERLENAEIVIMNKFAMDKEMISYAKNLKLICVCATGFDNTDLEECRKRGIDVRNVRGYSTDSVAQVTVSTVLSLVNSLEEYNSYVKDGSYTKGGSPNHLEPVYHEVSGMTWGVIGAGAIGKKVLKVAEAFGARTMVYSRSKHEGMNNVSLEELCRKSDIITIHVPLNDGTRGLINEKTLSYMKKDVVLVNEARGAVFDEEAVCKALEDGRIGALGVDVFTKEPFGEDSPYYRIKDKKNVILTPHMAWGSHEARVRCVEEVAKNIEDYKNKGKRNSVV